MRSPTSNGARIGVKMMSWHDVGAVHPSDRVIVVAPARSRHMALADGEGCPLGLRDYMERPTGIGDIAAHGETADDAAVVVRDLDAQGDLRWKDVIAGFLVHACGGGVRRYAQDDWSAVGTILSRDWRLFLLAGVVMRFLMPSTKRMVQAFHVSSISVCRRVNPLAKGNGREEGKGMTVEDLIVSTISDAKPMMILALCTIVLFVIVASLIEAWLAKARKAKSEADTLPSGPEASQRSVEKSEAVEQAVDNAGGFDLDERRKARAPKSIPDRRPWFFKTVMGRGLVCLLTKVIPILLPVVWFSLVVMGMLPNPLALFFFSPDPQRMNVVSPSNGWFWLLLTMFIVAVLHDSLPSLLRRLGWMMDEPKTASASLTSMVEDHYGVSNLEVDWFGTAAGGVPPFDGLYSCCYDTGRRKNNGVLRVQNHRVWLYGPDGCEEERHEH